MTNDNGQNLCYQQEMFLLFKKILFLFYFAYTILILLRLYYSYFTSLILLKLAF